MSTTNCVPEYWSRGHCTIFRILSLDHPMQSMHPHLLIKAPPTQLVSETVAKYFQHYLDFIHLRAFLEENNRNLNEETELDKFFASLIHSQRIFIIFQEERISNNSMVQQKFTQGAIVNIINLYG